MSTTTMHFGPEWMRTRHQPVSRPQHPPSPPPLANNTPTSGTSSYSALVSPAPPPQQEKRDETHPFRYSKEEMLRIYKEGGGKGGLGLEVEQWEGVVREMGSDPIGLREMTEAEKKLFAGPLNSELRRRQSTDFPPTLSTQAIGVERPRLSHSASSASGSPLRERFGSFMGRRRDGTDVPSLTIPRKLSMSGAGPQPSPRDTGLSSPRTRIGVSPSFDGVLNSADSWMARRRTSEGISKVGGNGGIRDGSGDNPDTKGLNIQEENEEDQSDAQKSYASPDESTRPQPGPSHSLNLASSTRDTSKSPDTSLSDGINNVSLADSVELSGSANASATGSQSSSVAPPPASLPDPANVEWSYLDPQGQVQGPFRADLMQKWYDEGYFAPDLLMKRANIDMDWIPVAELARRSTSDKIFLSLPLPLLQPPGLSKPESPLPAFNATPTDSGSGPYQPSPVRNVRSTTLDTFLGTGSAVSDSPASSFGAGRFGNGSPDPSAFGGRAAADTFLPDGSSGLRISGFATNSSIAFAGSRRETYDPSLDPSLGMRSNVFGNIAPGRAATLDSYGFNGGFVTPQALWAPNIQGMGGINGAHTPDSAPYATGFTQASNVAMPSLNHSASYGSLRGTAFDPSNTQSFPQPATEDKPLAMLQHVETNALSYTSPHQFGRPARYESPAQDVIPASALAPDTGLPQTNLNTSIPTVPTQSPWDNVTDTTSLRRTGPFDAPHPKSTNTVSSVSIAPPQPAPWGRAGKTSAPVTQIKDVSPWYQASQDAGDEKWKEAPGPNSLTISNLNQHNQQQQQLAAAEAVSVPQPVSESPQQTAPPDLSPAAESQPATITPTNQGSTRPRGKSTSQQVQKQQAPATVPSAPTQSKNPSPPPATQSKAPAWSNDDDTKRSKPSGITLSLREIQEAEARKSGARKAAEKERAARAAATTTATTTEDVQPFTTSWGLPTSQTGSRGAPVVPKEPSAGNNVPPAVSPPVWTTSGKPPVTKKSMKEIQEEEERRKKLAVKETTASAARRAYAETTNKSSTPIHTPPTSGNAWTTVGPGGKATLAATTAAIPARPLIAPLSSHNSPVSSSASRTNGTAALRLGAQTSTKTSPAATRVDDSSVTPSHEFLKWLGESLKGLNNSVNVEEIISMLLSFPLDPDSSTTEIISDLIYANSTTLDGRRFAAEFISKRKADAASKSKGTGVNGAGSTKPVSIADVVKAQPKPMQPEWGGFKVVNKKKKGGRA